MTKKNYSIELKCKYVAFYLESLQKNPKTSYTKTAKTLNIDRRVIVRWIKMKDELFSIKNKRRISRIPNTNSTALCPTMEFQLKKSIDESRERDVCIDGDSIRAKAIEIYHEIHPLGHSNEIPNDLCDKENKIFKASSGWLQNFCARNNFTYRRITTTGRDLPNNAIDRINDFYIEVSLLK